VKDVELMVLRHELEFSAAKSVGDLLSC